MAKAYSDHSVRTILGLQKELLPRSSSARCRTVPERRRTLYSQLALDKMEAIFEKNPYPDLDIREILSQEFGVPESKIQVWFQNRRTRRGRTKSRRGPYTTKQTISKHPYTHVIQPLSFPNTLPWFHAPSAMLPSLIPRCSPSADYWIPSRTSDHHPNGQQQDKLRELLIGELRTYETTASDDDPQQTSDIC